MWVLLSSRIRTWVLLALGVPVARQAIRYLRKRIERRHPDASSAKALRNADSVLARVDRREKRRAQTTKGH